MLYTMPLSTFLGLSAQTVTLLRITPLLSTTASLTHAYMEYITTTSFLHSAPTGSAISRAMLKNTNAAQESSSSTPVNAEQLAAAKESVVPAWFVNFFCRGVWSVIGLNSVTLLSAGLNLWGCPDGLGQGRKMYVMGLVAAAAHYVFVPLVAPSVERLFEMCVFYEQGVEDVGMSAVESVREWAANHKVRMVSVDLIAVVSFGIGVVKCLAR